ncbi:hypothetical protein IAR55_001666 [Kwoniella newhampshirensis]|uniref:Rab-GAP TBC domain-containing protein n=1 Tax=Kwoniella newhampshirensis TaxID=1651941 RepID=A0AAW0Z2U6_9TREE
MSTHLQDWIELLNAEQHVDVDKLREHARHGIAARVRGEVWLYLLNVLSADKTSEITSLLSLNTSYQSLPSSIPSYLSSMILQTALSHHTKRFKNETYAGLITSITAEQPGSSSSTAFRGGGGGGSNPMNMTSGSRTTPSHQNHHQQQRSSSSSSDYIPTPTRPNILTRPPDSYMVEAAGGGGGGGGSGEENDPTLNTIRSQLSRILPPPPSSPPSRHAFLSNLEEVLGKFWNAEKMTWRDDQYRRQVSRGMEQSERDWVYLCTPFLCCLARSVSMFMGFQQLMERLRSFPPLPSRLASFLTLFRLAIPELHSYCEDEQVPFVQVGLSWMTTLLSKEMWLGDVLRLWDAYLASDDMFALHCYVCVAILATCKETLEELDGSEAKLMLLDLPPMDVDRLLQDAANLRVSFPLPRPVEDQ